MSGTIKNANYFTQGFRELDETLAETTSILAKSRPLDPELRALVPWEGDDAYPRLRFSTWIGRDSDGHPFGRLQLPSDFSRRRLPLRPGSRRRNSFRPD
ncbi:MAG: hypothetical protein OSA93_12515 [Akkermansiaceae bacterium]|nr:hypothetical protein [Akkermansiaceae bacterium]